MSSIDERIVEMKFDNAQFEKNSSTTMSTLDKLKKALSFKGAANGLDEVSKSASRFSLAGISDGVQSIASKFSALSVIGITALTNIANKAVNTGLQIANSLTIAPISDGFSEYELKMGSIQTMLANTARYGTTLGDVSKSLNELNTYADKTIYNFGDMTRNIGLFTNAGIRVEDATKMIKGFSNVAAASGTSSQGAAGAAYQLSQALSTGTVRLMDWKSLTNVGMGNKNMQDDLISIADAMGTVSSSGTTATDIQSNFNASLEKGWLSADVMSNYLQIMAGDMDDAKMKSLGLTDAQIEGLKKTAATAEDAATKVRSMTQLMGTLAEGVGSGWAQTFEIIFGDFNEATDLFTGVYNKLNPLIDAMSNARNNLLQTWKDLGGRKEAIAAISNAFDALMVIVNAVKDAFRTVFPPMTGKKLYDLTVKVKEFSEKLKMGGETLKNFRIVLIGIASGFHIVWTIIKAVGSVIQIVLGQVFKGTGGFMAFAAKIATFVTNLDRAIRSGQFFERVSDSIARVIITLIARGQSIIGVFSKLGDVFSGVGKKGTSGIESFLNGIATAFEKFSNVSVSFDSILGVVVDGLTNFVNGIKSVASKIGSGLGPIGEGLSNFISSINPMRMLATINLGLIGGVLFKLIGMVGNISTLAKRLKKLKGEDIAGGVKGIMAALKGGGDDDGEGLSAKIKGVFGSLTDTLTKLQTSIKVGTLLLIAAAIGILVLSLMGLSTLDPQELAQGLGAISILLVQLMGTLKVFGKILAGGGFGDIIKVAAALVIFAIAVRLLTSSVKALAELDWASLAKGLLGVGALLGMIAGFSHILGKPEKIFEVAAAMILMGVAIKILVSAVKDLAASGWEELGKGLLGVGTLLAIIAGFTHIVGSPEKMISIGAGMILISVAIKMLASSIETMGGFSMEVIGKGLLAIGGALLAIGIATRVMPKDMLVKAAAMVVIAYSLKMLADALKAMGGMGWEEIGKSLVMLAGSLAILAGALYLMSGALPGAAALIVAAYALGVLAPPLMALGGMEWGAIGNGLVMLGGSLLIMAAGLTLMIAALPGAIALGVAAVSLKAFLPVLQGMGSMDWGGILGGLGKLAVIFLGLSVASLLLLPAVPILALFGAAILILGAGMALAGAGMAAFSAGLLALVAVGTVTISFLTAMIGLIPMLMTAIATGIVSFLGVIAASGTTIVATIVTILSSILTAITTLVPQLITTAVTLFSGLLQAIQIIAPQLISTGLLLIMDFVTAIVTLVPFLVDAGMQLITGILTGIAQNIGKIVTVAVSIVVNFINAIAANLPRIVQAGFNLILSFINSLTDGINRNAGKLRTAMKGLATAMIDAITGGLGSKIGSVLSKVGEIGSQAISKFKEFFNLSKGAEIAKNVVSGIANGISNGISAVTTAAKNLAKNALDAAKNFLGIESPSKEFFKVGEFSDQGLAKGLDSKSHLVAASSKNVAKTALKTMSKALSDVDNILSENVDHSPVITPVLDLSRVSKDSATLSGMLDTGASYSAAIKASGNLRPSDFESKVNAGETGKAAGTNVVINQTITSPKAVSAAEVYRGSKNLVSVLKGELA